jgi:hypothetical protein
MQKLIAGDGNWLAGAKEAVEPLLELPIVLNVNKGAIRDNVGGIAHSKEAPLKFQATKGPEHIFAFSFFRDSSLQRFSIHTSSNVSVPEATVQLSAVLRLQSVPAVQNPIAPAEVSMAKKMQLSPLMAKCYQHLLTLGKGQKFTVEMSIAQALKKVTANRAQAGNTATGLKKLGLVNSLERGKFEVIRRDIGDAEAAPKPSHVKKTAEPKVAAEQKKAPKKTTRKKAAKKTKSPQPESASKHTSVSDGNTLQQDIVNLYRRIQGLEKELSDLQQQAKRKGIGVTIDRKTGQITTTFKI